MANKWVLDCSAMASVMLMETEGRETDDLLEQALADRIHISVRPLFWCMSRIRGNGKNIGNGGCYKKYAR